MSQLAERWQRSNALHERVRRFACASFAESAHRVETFDDLALDIARFQRQFSVVTRSLSTGSGALNSWQQLPAVVSDVFRRRRVAVHPPEQDVALFRTSGTTAGQGQHAFRSLETYAQLTVAWGRRALQLPASPMTVLALASPHEPECRSSLSFMMAEFMTHFDGQNLRGDTAPLNIYEPGRWLLTEEGVDVSAFSEAVQCAERRGHPVLLLATSFALVWLLDTLGGETLPLPSGSLVMHTGGFKGRTRTVAPAQLRCDIGRALAVNVESIRSEYGMTELSSQLYDQGQGAIGQRGGHVYQLPPWLRVEAVNPSTHQAVAPGQVGWARFTDLANVDSALVVLTQDRIRLCSGGLELLGRNRRVPVRGCSLAIEEDSEFPQLSDPPFHKPRQPRMPPSPVAATMDSSGQNAPGVRLLRLQTAVGSLIAPGSASRRNLIGELSEETGLSVAGVVRGLDECLELNPSDAELKKLLGNTVSTDRAHVVLPARVFAATYRALALALVSSSRVMVKPSRRQSVFVRAIDRRIPGLFQIVDRLNVSPGEHLWVYGSDETIENLRTQVVSGVTWHAHGTGYGVVAVRHADIPSVAHAIAGKNSNVGQRQRVLDGIARDVALFDQQGCLSPRAVLFEGSQSQAAEFAVQLAQALAREALRTPQGLSSVSERADGSRALLNARALGSVFAAGSGWVSLPDPDCRLPEASDVLPAGRVLEVRTVPELQSALVPLAPWLTAVGCSSDSLGEAVSAWLPQARVSDTGEMQRPLFDGPVDRRKANQ